MIINITNPHASYYLGGTEVVSLYQALSLAKRGHTIRFFVRKPEQYSDYFNEFKQQAEDLGITIVEIKLDESVPYANGRWPIYYMLATEFGVAAQTEYLGYNDADIFVAHQSADMLYLPNDTIRILHLHGTPHETDSLMDAAMARPHYTVAHSTSIRYWWHSNYPNLLMDTFRNGVDTKLYHANPTAERPIDVLYVGRFLEHKGIDDILNAASKNLKIVIAGNGPYLDQLKKIAAGNKLSDVTFIERPGNDELRELYKSAKIFACPSRAKEGVLTTMLEAGAAGCAVITASGSGMTDLAEDGVNSLVVKPGDVNAIARGIKQLLSDNNRRMNLAESMQKDIQSLWSWETKGKELEGVYCSATQE
jgi:glycosyltransferase involved in cell wall biosynthesis